MSVMGFTGVGESSFVQDGEIKGGGLTVNQDERPPLRFSGCFFTMTKKDDFWFYGFSYS